MRRVASSSSFGSGKKNKGELKGTLLLPLPWNSHQKHGSLSLSHAWVPRTLPRFKGEVTFFFFGGVIRLVSCSSLHPPLTSQSLGVKKAELSLIPDREDRG